jgi:hypothetical protein
MRFIIISRQTVITSLSSINKLDTVMEVECVSCEVRTKDLYTMYINFTLQRLKDDNLYPFSGCKVPEVSILSPLHLFIKYLLQLRIVA